MKKKKQNQKTKLYIAAAVAAVVVGALAVLFSSGTLFQGLLPGPVPQLPQIYTVSCAPETATGNVGEDVTWSATHNAGSDAVYSWTWDPEPDSKSEPFSTILTRYNDPGTKLGFLTVSDKDGYSIPTPCGSVEIEAPPISLSCYPTLDGSKKITSADVATKITWVPRLMGGVAPYGYKWGGYWSDKDNPFNDPRTNETFVNVYGVTGPVKPGQLSVADSVGQTKTVTCDPLEIVEPKLEISCSGSPSKPKIGEKVKWESEFINNVYQVQADSYSWTGSDGLSSDWPNIEKTYYSAGTKSATIVYKVGAETLSKTCTVAVQPDYTPPPSPSNPYISSLSIGDTPYDPEKDGSTSLNWYVNNYDGRISHQVEIFKYPFKSGDKAVRSWDLDVVAGGKHSLTWDGENIYGDLVSDGDYFFEVSGEEDSSGYDLSPAQYKFVVDRDEDPSPTPPPSNLCAGFKDVLATNSLCDAIEWAKDEGIFTGNPDGTLGIYDLFQRDQAAKVVLEASNQFSSSADYCRSVNPFYDVTPQLWSYQYICRGVDRAVITGYKSGPDAGYYRPARYLNRAEALALALRTTNYNIPDNNVYSFDDVGARDWFSGYAKFAKDNRLYTGSYLNPGEYVTRGEVIELLYDIEQL